MQVKAKSGASAFSIGTRVTREPGRHEYTDPETGFIYLRARYYDPTTAQFLTRDPLNASTRSAYGYTGNDPLNGSDPSGLSKCGDDWTSPGSWVDCASKAYHEDRKLTKKVQNKEVAVVAVFPYAAYYTTYRTQGSISGYLPGWVNTWMTDFEAGNLVIDQWLDHAKRCTGSTDESNDDEGHNGGVLPVHVNGLDKKPGDPGYTYLPGVDRTGRWEVGPNSYGWGAGWGPR